MIKPSLSPIMIKLSLSQDKEYSIHPLKYERTHCRIFDNSGRGPILRSLSDLRSQSEAGLLGEPALPDLSKGWINLGKSNVDGQVAVLYQLKEIKGQQVSTHRFYVSEVDGIPLKLHTIGTEILEGSHYDE